jgi:hypothetical protein
MIVRDTTVRTVTIVLVDTEIADIETIVEGFLVASGVHANNSETGTAKRILKALEVNYGS